MRRGLLGLAWSVLVASAAGAQGGDATPVAPRGRPPLEPARLTGQVAAGAYAGFLGFFVGRFVGERVADLARLGEDADARRGTMLTFAYAGAALGTAGVVHGIGNIGDQTGEFGLALAGTGAGFVAALGINRFLCPPPAGQAPRHPRCRIITDVVEVLLPAIGSTIAFNSSRRFAR